MKFEPLTNDIIRKNAPSVFSDVAHSRTSEKYGLIPTIDVVEAMRKEGWLPVQAQQVIGRSEEMHSTAKHLLRFRHVDTVPIVGDSHPEIVLRNSHNGRGSFHLDAGLFRLACSNGMVIADSMFETRKYRHSQNVFGEIIEGTYEVIEEVPQIAASMKKYNGILIDGKKRHEFGRRALELIKSQKSEVQYDIDQLVAPTRREDERPSLWNTFNIIQEKVVNGGITGSNQNGRRVRTRGINSIRKNVVLNKDLWQLTDDFYNELKAA